MCEMLKKLLNKEFLLEKILLLFISVFIFFTMYYYDNQTTFVCIIENMNRIANGQWYYIFNGWSAIPYGLLLQGTCAIWALPVFILSRLGIISVTGIGARLWYKLFVLIFFILTSLQYEKLAKKLGVLEEKIIWLKLYFLSSLMVIIPAVHIAQMDVVYLFFILLGISYYLTDEHWKFLICFMIAIPGKYLPLFIFIPLVLLNEKRYLYIMRDVMVGCALIVVDRGMNSIGYRIESFLGIDKSIEISGNDQMLICLDNMLNSNITAFRSPMSLAILCFAVLCIWCYLKKYEDRKKLAVFVSFIGISILFSFGDSTPYWIILLMPFMLLLIFQNERYSNILIPLEVAFSLGYIYIFIFETSWILGAENSFSFLLCSLIPGYLESAHGFISDFLRQRGLADFSGAMAALLLACIIGIATITYPLKKEDNTQIEAKLYIKGGYWARLALVYAWVLWNIWVVMLNHVN